MCIYPYNTVYFIYMNFIQQQLAEKNKQQMFKQKNNKNDSKNNNLAKSPKALKNVKPRRAM